MASVSIANDKASEFAQLQREYRHMELNRKSYADESYLVLRKQQATIAKLRKDNESLKMELGVETRNTVLKPAEIAETSRFHDEADRLDRLMREAAQHIADLDEEISRLKQRATEQRKAMGGVNAARENQVMVQKQVKILENRLDQALVKFNQALATNKSLRENIDDLRRERVVFDNIYRKLDRELHEKKKQMANVIELSNLSYEQRDNYQMEIAAIEQANRKEQDEFEAQMLELGRLLENELRLPAPSTQRTLGLSGSGGALGNPTIMMSPQQQQLQGGGGSHNTTGGLYLGNEAANLNGLGSLSSAGSPTGRASRAVSATGAKGGKRSTIRRTDQSKEKAELAVGEERVQNFEEAFNRIKAATGISAIDELVRMFIKNEDQNFSLFNYVNEQTNEIEKLGEQVQRLVDEEAKYAQESGEDVNQHKQLVQDLDRKLEATETQAAKYEERCEAYQLILDNLKRSIASAFTKTHCEDRVVAAGGSADVTVFADSNIVTEANMLPYLAMIEEQCNAIIKDYVAVKQRTQQKLQGQGAAASSSNINPNAAAANNNNSNNNDNNTPGGIRAPSAPSAAAVLGLGPTTPMGQDLIHVNPPKLEDYSSEEDDDDDDDETRPLTRDELKAKTAQRMFRRVNPGGASRKQQQQQQQQQRSNAGKPKK